MFIANGTSGLTANDNKPGYNSSRIMLLGNKQGLKCKKSALQVPALQDDLSRGRVVLSKAIPMLSPSSSLCPDPEKDPCFDLLEK